MKTTIRHITHRFTAFMAAVSPFSFSRSFILLAGVLIFSSLRPAAQQSQYNYATGTVKGRHFVGGLAGRAVAPGSAVINSYARGSVTGERKVGGLIGENGSLIEKSYSTGKVTGSAQTGGLTGAGSGTVTASYWDTQTSVQATSAGGTGRMTDPMTYPYASDTYAGWNFSSVWKADTPPAQNGGYPLLGVSGVYQVLVQVFPLGAGTVTGEGSYLSGQQALLSTVAAQGYVFTGWMQGSQVLSNQTHFGITVSSPVNLVAQYRLKTTSAFEPLTKRTETMAIYPNPVDQTLTIDLSGISQLVTGLKIMNLSGQTIMVLHPGKSFTNQLTINVSQWPAGLYVVAASHRDGLTTARFIKKGQD